MEHYYLSKEVTRHGNVIHKSGCVNLPDVENRIYFGYLANDTEAVEEARQYCQEVSACLNCMDITYINSFNEAANAGMNNSR